MPDVVLLWLTHSDPTTCYAETPVGLYSIRKARRGTTYVSRFDAEIVAIHDDLVDSKRACERHFNLTQRKQNERQSIRQSRVP